jgi:hypothetical protein
LRLDPDVLFRLDPEHLLIGETLALVDEATTRQPPVVPGRTSTSSYAPARAGWTTSSAPGDCAARRRCPSTTARPRSRAS